MRIAIIGVTGKVGSRIAAEAIRRGHSVTGIARTRSDVDLPAGVTVVEGDATKPDTIVETLRGHDAVVSAVLFRLVKSKPVLEAVRQAGVKRLLVVGGAGSLEVSPGTALVDTPAFPEAFKVEAMPGKIFLLDLRKVTDIDWTFQSPALEFAPGQRTGKYRTSGDTLMRDKSGKSRISMEDFAVATLDELEKPKHVKKRFGVLY
ncbi:MAG: NAD(P)-dependent oxidoreductase [Pseudolabrys sp.]